MKNYKSTLITFGIGLAIALFIILSKHIFQIDDTKKVFHILSDAFLVPGILIFGFGLLVVASNGGTFDMLSYGFTKLFDLFRKDVTKVKHRTFYDYRVAREGNKSKSLYLVITGLVFIAFSVLFLILYNQY